jgi:hypothetical protein
VLCRLIIESSNVDFNKVMDIVQKIPSMISSDF